ncbi:hypothetical protein Tco_1555904 [Tanacetum coccineum]
MTPHQRGSLYQMEVAGMVGVPRYGLMFIYQLLFMCVCVCQSAGVRTISIVKRQPDILSQENLADVNGTSVGCSDTLMLSLVSWRGTLCYIEGSHFRMWLQPQTAFGASFMCVLTLHESVLAVVPPLPSLAFQ